MVTRPTARSKRALSFAAVAEQLARISFQAAAIACLLSDYPVGGGGHRTRHFKPAAPIRSGGKKSPEPVSVDAGSYVSVLAAAGDQSATQPVPNTGRALFVSAYGVRLPLYRLSDGRADSECEDHAGPCPHHNRLVLLEPLPEHPTVARSRQPVSND